MPPEASISIFLNSSFVKYSSAASLKFEKMLVERIKKLKLGNGLDKSIDIGPLVNQVAQNKSNTYVDIGLKEGAKLLIGGHIPKMKGFFFEPTVFVDVTAQMQIFKEEVFGPVVCINKFSNRDEAIELVNNTDFGLAASIWTRDNAKALDLAKQINAGTIWINTYGMFYNEVPYGGFKQSGFGKDLSAYAFDYYTVIKFVYVDITGQARKSWHYTVYGDKP
jgi:betaine-aldehyde dehydrogenase